MKNWQSTTRFVRGSYRGGLTSQEGKPKERGGGRKRKELERDTAIVPKRVRKPVSATRGKKAHEEKKNPPGKKRGTCRKEKKAVQCLYTCADRTPFPHRKSAAIHLSTQKRKERKGEKKKQEGSCGNGSEHTPTVGDQMTGRKTTLLQKDGERGKVRGGGKKKNLRLV